MLNVDSWTFSSDGRDLHTMQGFGKCSPIYARLKTSSRQLLPSNAHIIGDSAYQCEFFLMCPYRDNGHLTKHKSTSTWFSVRRMW